MPLFEPPASGSEVRSWGAVAVWTVSIFAAIPLARSMETWVREHLGQAAFGWFVLGVLALATLATGWAVARTARSRTQGGSLVWLIGVAAAFAASTMSLWSNPEEAMHFVQYGVLAVLLFRACAHRFVDHSVYVVAGLLGVAVGCLDEAIQWLTPMRYFGVRDIGLNAYASGLVQLAIAKGIAPSWVETGMGRRGRRAAVRTVATIGLLLFVFSLNTPPRVDAYARRIPGLAFLVDNPSTMIEYGHRYADPAIGVFRSRLSPGELAEHDARYGEAAGTAVASWDESKGGYSGFLALYSAQRDPYVHEFRVHLFRRDAHRVYFGRSKGEAARREHATVVLREDLILDGYFGTALAYCDCELGPHERAELEARASTTSSYDSPVGGDLVSGFREWQLLLVFGAGFIGLLVLDRRLRAAEPRG